MRTAVALLVLLALAAVPGSVFPQRGVASDPAAVVRFERDHPVLTPWLDRLQFFEVYSSAWFAAIYLLLLVSLTGCVLPRTRQLWRDARGDPPAAPSRLDREDGYAVVALSDPDAALADAERQLRAARFHVIRTRHEVRAEKGRIRELGNLGFHLSLLLLLVGVAGGKLFGYEGRVAVIEGQGFTNVASSYDALTPAPLADIAGLAPFSFTLDAFTASFETQGDRIGEPRDFEGDVTFRTVEGAERAVHVKSNRPMELEGTKFFLTGHGYAPEITVRDGSGAVVMSGPTLFLPSDEALTSDRVLKVVDAQPESLALSGVFAPTVADPTATTLTSFYPDAVDPRLRLEAWTGDLGLGSGQPQSVYTLDYSSLDQVVTEKGQLWEATLAPGDSADLPDGLGSVTFDGYARFANFQVARDPGKEISLAAAILLLVGLTVSLGVPRRRIWVRMVSATTSGGTPSVEMGGRSLSRRGIPPAELTNLRHALVQIGIQTVERTLHKELHQ